MLGRGLRGVGRIGGRMPMRMASTSAPAAGGGGGSTQIPSDRLYSGWPDAGIPGGIPDRTTISTTINTTGDSTDRTSTINSGISGAAAGSVVKLGTGTFRCTGRINFANEQSVVLRGNGPGVTILDSRVGSGAAILIGNGSADWPWNVTGTSLSANAAADATVISLSSTASFSVGDRVAFYQEDDGALPVLDVDNGVGTGAQAFRSKITAKDSSTITIQDPLPFALTTSRNAVTHLIGDGFAYSCGIEDMTIDCTNGSPLYGVQMWNCDQVWLKNVRVILPDNYGVYMMNGVHCEFYKLYVDSIKNAGSNGAGILTERSSSYLIHNCIIYKAFPHLEQNFGCSGNVFAYNFTVDNSVAGVTQGSSINTNHGAHNSFNLYEGNVSPQFCSDGYFGSASHDTAFRNRFHGTNEGGAYSGANGSHCVELNRFTRKYSLVENVVGATQSYWTSKGAGTLVYEVTANGGSEPCLYQLGYPNIGNNDYTGTAEPSTGDYWASWSSPNGPSGWQERDLDVPNTIHRKRNYASTSSGIPAGESQTETEPESLYLTAKPSWFNSLGWPAYGTGGDTSFDITDSFEKIPAGYRYYNGGADPA